MAKRRGNVFALRFGNPQHEPDVKPGRLLYGLMYSSLLDDDTTEILDRLAAQVSAGPDQPRSASPRGG